jgi:purine nucleosidase
MVRIHLDTDIGGDIDDLCALALLLRWPEAELTGVTTVAEENGRRAGYARYVLRLAGRADIPVAAGADVATGRFRDHPGYPDETRYWPELVAPAPGPLEDALDLLEASIEQGAVIVAVGPFTNLALLEQRSPGILARSQLVLMGGYIRPIRPGYPQMPRRDDYNVQQDVAAAQQVFEAGHPLVVPMTVTVETALRRGYLPVLRRSGPLGALIARQAEAHDADYQTAARYGATCPRLPDDIVNFQHDPLAVAVALGWDGAGIEHLPLVLRVEDGWLREEERPGGRPTAIVTAVDGERFNELWYQRVVSA